MKINIVNIGCFKNLVDSEKLMGNLVRNGFIVEFGEPQSFTDIMIINTCGFIGDAEKDSLNEIEKYAKQKVVGRIGQLWVMGCYAQKKSNELKIMIPQVDRVYGNFEWTKIVNDLGGYYLESCDRVITTPAHYSYIKIAEGCSQVCSYCIKPILNGPLHSTEIKDIVKECSSLVGRGVKELQLVAQNSTAYGIDIYGRRRIAELVERISDIPGVEWIRIHYAYPNGFPIDLLKVIRERENVCNYLDMAIQHCSDKMLKLMRRPMSKQELIDLISLIRSEVPGIYLRTTLMTGHPGELPSDFEELYAFVEDMRFERMGVFAYSHEKGTYCDKNYTDSIPEMEKRRRALLLMELQKKYYNELNTSLIGTTEKAIIDRFENGFYYGRGEHSTPMSDPKIYIKSDTELQIGSFHNVKIIASRGKDMDGVVANNF